jgi:hypothetical protein
MAKQFSQTHSQSDRRTAEPSSRQIFKTVDRYGDYEAEDESDVRLSLSNFQAKVKSTLSASKARAAKT